MEHGHAREKAGGDRLLRAERWISLLHKAAVTALALASLWLILQ
jgi:hypothetical protein